MKALLFLSLALLIPHAAASEKFPGVKMLMTSAEAEHSGINGLSDEQLAALNRWLIRYTASEADLVKQTAEVKLESFKPISSNISGLFRGWNGKTKFKLDNGQVWQQRYNNQWTTKLDNPEVTIKRNTLGFFDMKVLSKNRVIGVKRIK